MLAGKTVVSLILICSLALTPIMGAVSAPATYEGVEGISDGNDKYGTFYNDDTSTTPAVPPDEDDESDEENTENSNELPGGLPLSGRTIILDPGHGVNSDNVIRDEDGNIIYSEHVAMLFLARALRERLQPLGATVLMTRTGNANVTLPVRCARINIWALEAVRSELTEQWQLTEVDRLIGLMRGIINDPTGAEGRRLMNVPFNPEREIHPDLRRIFEYQNHPVIRNNFLAISLHSNATGTPINPDVRGAEVFYVNPAAHANTHTYFPGFSFTRESRLFGDILLDHIAAIQPRGIPRRTWGLRAANFFFLREINVPAVLAENGFHTSPIDRELLMCNDFLESMADAYVDAIIEYFEALPSGEREPWQPPPPPTPRPPPPHPPRVPGQTFHDVQPTAVAFNAVEWAARNNIATGANDMFNPTVPMTRAQFALMLWRWLGSPAPGAGGHFSDVDPNRVVAPAIRWAANNGIVTGAAGLFKPDEEMTRAQMVIMMHRLSIMRRRPVTASAGATDNFSDRHTISAVAAAPLRWAVTHGLMTGHGDRLNPNDSITRAQAVIVLHRYAHGIGR